MRAGRGVDLQGSFSPTSNPAVFGATLYLLGAGVCSAFLDLLVSFLPVG